MKRIDIEDIETIATEADAAFGAGAADLRSLTIEMEQAVALMLTIKPDMMRTLKATKVPLSTVKERAGELRTTARNLRAISAAIQRTTPMVGQLIATR